MENERGLDFPENGKRKMENGKSNEMLELELYVDFRLFKVFDYLGQNL